MRLASNNGDDDGLMVTPKSLANQVEAMVLQTKVDTLSWQLKQVRVLHFFVVRHRWFQLIYQTLREYFT